MARVQELEKEAIFKNIKIPSEKSSPAKFIRRGKRKR